MKKRRLYGLVVYLSDSIYPSKIHWMLIAIDFTDSEAFHNHNEKECTPLENPNNNYCFSYKPKHIKGRKTINKKSKNNEEYIWKTFYDC